MYAVINSMCAKSLQWCLTLCDHVDWSPAGSSVHGFSRQKYRSGLPSPPPEDLPHPGMEPTSPVCPALAGTSFATRTMSEAQRDVCLMSVSLLFGVSLH